MIAFNISNPNEVALQIAARVKARRLELDLTQEGLAARAGVKCGKCIALWYSAT